MICPNDAEARSRPSGHNGPLKVTIEGPSDLGHLETYLTLEQWFCTFTAKPTGGRPPYRYEWTASDGGSYSGQTGRYYPTALGNQWVQVKVTDKNDESVTLKKDIMVHERLEILSAQASQADQGPEFLIAEHTNDTDQPQEWGNALTATAEVTVGLTVTGGLDTNAVASKVGASYTSTETVTHSHETTTPLIIAPGQTGYYWGTKGTNVVDGEAKQWNTCSEGASGSYQKREPPYIKTRSSLSD
jgi:hypothetical protein